MRKFIIFLLFFIPTATTAQVPANGAGISLSPARFELEMQPGTETTVVVNLDYRSTNAAGAPARIVASLNDWTITNDGCVEYYRANTRPGSASSWLVYSPGE